jgi:hypothetical protein
MAPFEMLYGRRCQTPLFWSATREQKVFEPDILQEAERQVRIVRENLRITQSRQKSYADQRRKELSFKVGDYVYLKESPMREVYDVLRYEANLHLGSLNHSRSRRREVSSLSIRVTTAVVRCARRVTCLSAKEVFMSA